MTLAVTLVKLGSGYPVFEVGAYQYVGTRLPDTGDTITITRAPGVETHGPRQRLVYVTRVDPRSEVPIRAVEAAEDCTVPEPS
jgi:hypothetical protein